MPRVVVLGSSNTDMVVRLPRLPAPGETLLGGSFLTGPGGKGANQAVAARRAGADVVFIAAVGDDLFGRQAIAGYRQEGIDVSHVVNVADVPSGVALIFVGDDGENAIGVAPGANARLLPAAIDRLPDSLFQVGDVLLVGLEIPLATVERAVARSRLAGMRVILNPAPADPRLAERGLLRFVDVLTPNRLEAATLAGLPAQEDGPLPAAALQALRSKGVGNVIVTLGGDGCLVFEKDAEPAAGHWIAPYPVVAVDTVGAGDAFSGALAAALADGRALFEAAVWASAAAALAVTKPGAQAALPLRAEIDRLAADHRGRLSY